MSLRWWKIKKEVRYPELPLSRRSGREADEEVWVV
jgi:hypothetical protein